MKTLAIVQPGEKLSTLTPLAGDFSDWILWGMPRPQPRTQICRPHRGEPLPPDGDVAAVIVTGSNAMVTDRAQWMEETAAWLRCLVEQNVPVLGICFGHQLLAYALGGEVRDNPNGTEVGTVTTRLTNHAQYDPLLHKLPTSLVVQASHRQSVVKLPEAATLLATSDQDPHHAFRVGASAWGVQFHPEFDAHIVKAYTEYYRPILNEQGTRADDLLALVQETPLANQILFRFGQYVQL